VKRSGANARTQIQLGTGSERSGQHAVNLQVKRKGAPERPFSETEIRISGTRPERTWKEA
jgi:hypothetical protein